MSEELKYKDGEDLIIKAKVIHDWSDNPCDYRLVIAGIYGNYVSEKELEDIVVETPQKPKVTQEVMDWYEEVKSERADWTISQWRTASPIPDWLYGENHLENQHALATLIAYGPDAVEVEKEKKYRVLIKDELVLNRRLIKNPITNIFEFVIGSNLGIESFTKQELIDAGFGDVFDNPMFEVEEVE